MLSECCRRWRMLISVTIANLLVPLGLVVPLAQATMGVPDARHLLSRTGFDEAPREVARVAQLSRVAAVDALLRASRAKPDTEPPGWVHEPIEGPRALREATPEQRQAFVREQARRAVELRSWWLGEMIATRSPLVERMTLFWHNHFATSQLKVRRAQYLYRQNQLFRDKALGNFGHLLHAVAKDPAMLIYLDAAASRRDRPNENFAREVMELFTLGEGQYTEQDVREAARAFTGWSIDPDNGEFVFRRALHDARDKTVLGQSGAFDGDQALDVMLLQPAAATFIVGKLWREFVSMEPQPDAVLRVAEKFRDSRYDIKVALHALLLEEAFWSEQNRGALIKSPIDLVVGTVRQFAIAVPDTMPLALITSQLGQRLFAPPNVKGWPGGEAWINASSLLARKQFLEQVFRSGERPITPPRDLPMMRGAAQFDRERLARTYHSIMFDPRQWMTELRAVSAGSPLPFILAPTRDGSMENTPENSTSGGIDGMTDDAHRATRAMDPIRAWVLDARYQLK